MALTPPTSPILPPAPDGPLKAYAYEAQSVHGQMLSGSIDACDAPDAIARLESVGLHVLTVGDEGKPRPGRALKGDDFIAFNQQLAELTAAGMPVERGLRLIAREMRSGRLKTTILNVVKEMDSGRSLGEAFDTSRSKFPPLYGELIDAGVKSNNLSGMLFNLGRHLEMTQRLRSAFWQALAYPLVVFVGLIAVILMISVYVLPEFHEVLNDFEMDLPAITKALFFLGDYAIAISIGLLGLMIGLMLFWQFAKMSGLSSTLSDAVGFPLPLLGRVLKLNLLARWCDAVRLGVDSGIALPNAIGISSRAIGSPSLTADSKKLVDALEAGRPAETAGIDQILTPSVCAAIDLSTRQDQLSNTLAGLSKLYATQADMRLSIIRSILSPLLLLFVAQIMLFTLAGLFLPIVSLITALTG